MRSLLFFLIRLATQLCVRWIFLGRMTAANWFLCHFSSRQGSLLHMPVHCPAAMLRELDRPILRPGNLWIY